MADWYETLRRDLTAGGHRPRELTWPGGRLLVTEHGARVMAVDTAGTPGLDANPFWTPKTIDTAPAGGDRLWIAPEIAYFWPSLEKAREDPVKYSRVLEAMDPGQFTVERAAEREVRLQAEMTLTDVRVDKTIRLRVRRAVHAVDAPAGLPADVAAVSFGTRHELTVMEGDPGAVAGAWALLQLPAAGTLIFPTTRRLGLGDGIRQYYDPFGDRHVQADDRAVRFLIDGQRRIKMGFGAAWSTGRMGFYRPTTNGDGRAVLVLRVFSPQPGEPYVDMPRAEEKTKRVGGDCVQAYNDGGGLESFGEMEHHDPAVIVGEGPQQRSASFVTHVLHGPDDAVRAVGAAMLGVAIEPIK